MESLNKSLFPLPYIVILQQVFLLLLIIQALSYVFVQFQFNFILPSFPPLFDFVVPLVGVITFDLSLLQPFILGVQCRTH